MTEADNKELVRSFYARVINGRDLDAIDELMATDCRHNGEERGRTGQRAAVEAFRAAVSSSPLRHGCSTRVPRPARRPLRVAANRGRAAALAAQRLRGDRGRLGSDLPRRARPLGDRDLPGPPGHGRLRARLRSAVDRADGGRCARPARPPGHRPRAGRRLVDGRLRRPGAGGRCAGARRGARPARDRRRRPGGESLPSRGLGRLTYREGSPREQATRISSLPFPPPVAAAIDRQFGEIVAAARASLDPAALDGQERAMRDWHAAAPPPPGPQPRLAAAGTLDEVIPPINAATLAGGDADWRALRRRRARIHGAGAGASCGVDRRASRSLTRSRLRVRRFVASGRLNRARDRSG